MAENDSKDCPFCAEPIRERATICPHCRSPLRSPASADAYRDHPGRQIAGVCVGIAEAFGVSVTFVRLAFIVLTFVSFIGPPLYLVLWLLLPDQPGAPSALGRVVGGDDGEASLLERAVRATEDVFDRVAAWLRRKTPPPEAPKGQDNESTPAEGAS